MTQRQFVTIVLWLLGGYGISLAAPADVPWALRNRPITEFTITAGNAVFDQSPGGVAEFDFGDYSGRYNLLTGYNAAHIYETPGEYTLTIRRQGQPDVTKPVHVRPDNRAKVIVQPTDNLADVIRGLPNNCVVLLPAGATFDVPRPIEINARNVCFRAAGSGPAPVIRRRTAFASSTLLVKTVDVTFDGITFDSDKPSPQVHGKTGFRAIMAEGARLVVKNCTFRNIDDCVFCTGLTRGVLVQWSTFTGEVRACGVWLDGMDVVVLGSTFQDSQEEHNIRASNVGFHNLLIYESDFTNTHGKETVTIRVGDNVYISHCAFHAWVKFGPGPRKDRPMTPIELKTKHVQHVVFTNNSLDNKAWVNVDEGTSDLTIRYNALDQDTVGVPLRAQGPSLSDIKVEGNIRLLTNGPTPKPLVREHETEPGNIQETGTVTRPKEPRDEKKR